MIRSFADEETERVRLDNAHPGEILSEDFLIGSDIPLEEVVSGSGIPAQRLSALLSGEIPVDADTACPRASSCDSRTATIWRKYAAARKPTSTGSYPAPRDS